MYIFPMSVYLTIRRIPLKYNFSQKRLNYTNASEYRMLLQKKQKKQKEQNEQIINSKRQKYINTSTKRFDYIKNSIQLINEVLFSKKK
jgi:hypothetical protein